MATPAFVPEVLPFGPPVEPMLAKAAGFPTGGPWLFEPKWDGFRTLIWREDDRVYLQSRDKKPMLRYFPELVAPLRASLPPRCVLDGELVVAVGDSLDFGALQQRIHPAKSRIDRLAAETPAAFVAFDLLALGHQDLREAPMIERRRMLEDVLADAAPPIHVTPMTRDVAVAREWFERFEGAGLDGVIAKPEALTYQPKKRAMVKIKHVRTCDVVVGGFRWHKKGPGELLGSLLLGLYADDGSLHHVGVTSSFKMDERRRLVDELAPLREGALDGHPWGSWAEAMQEHAEEDARKPGMKSRWSADKDLSWVPLRATRVCEVKFDHLEGGRFRHTATFLRWRADKPPAECTFDQIDVTPPYEVREIFRQ
ncbi:MAG: ATP-dependent DNA ligase [Myxococcales bacterium]|nr:ATP-dependent DNA ligase [Myxococcales bacterium]